MFPGSFYNNSQLRFTVFLYFQFRRGPRRLSGQLLQSRWSAGVSRCGTADTVIDMNHGVAQGIRRHVEPVVRSAVALVDDTAVVRLDNTEVLEGAASRHDMRLVALRQLHGNARWISLNSPALNSTSSAARRSIQSDFPSI